MVINLNELKDVCSKILYAVDTSESSTLTDSLELISEKGILSLSVTNKEYFVRVNLNVTTQENFHAAVNANLFLKLISSLTAENVELLVEDKLLRVKADGTYKLPLIFDGENVLTLPEITIQNVTQQFSIKCEVLRNILNNNLKELAKGYVKHPVQKLVYIDEKGALTFTTGACVVEFSLPSPIKLLINPKVVKLFKLFKDEQVEFSYGVDERGDGILQPKAIFKDAQVIVSSFLPADSSLINSVPASVIRGRALGQYDYCVNLNTALVLNAIKRLTLFAAKNTRASLYFHFKDNFVVVEDKQGNSETIKYDSNEQLVQCDYVIKLVAEDLRIVLESCASTHAQWRFGGHQAFVISRTGIHNVLPEEVKDGD